MINDKPFAPAAQTRLPQAPDLAQQQAEDSSRQTHVSTLAQQLYHRYMAGELKWEQVRTLHST